MTDTATTEGADGATDTTTTTEATTTETGATPATDLEAELAKWKAQARKHEDRAKSNAGAAKELEQLRASMMSDQEKAVADARAAGFADASSALGGRLVAAEIRAAAAGRLDGDQLTTLLDGVNVAAFLTDDGDVDTVKVTAFVEGLAPKTVDTTTSTFPDLGQGARGQGMALNGDPLEAALKAKLGIR